jgi:hypothetical protein
MSRALAVWGLFLLLAALTLLAFDAIDTQTYALLFGLAGAALVCAAVLWVVNREGDPEGTVRMEPDLSLPAAGLGVALFLLATSVVVGLWLALIAAGLVVWSLFGLVRERRGSRG